MALAFGTSGIRGLVSEFSAEECAQYVSAFVEFLRIKEIDCTEVVVARDLRESSPKIQELIVQALANHGFSAKDGGTVPTPVLAWACFELQLPGIMITGSHIPADRNGFKFYLPNGEILKDDEKLIFDLYSGSLAVPTLARLPAVTKLNLNDSFVTRYASVFKPDALADFKIGFYQHSSVGRDLFVDILKRLGASVTPFGRADTFIPVDTEAVTAVDFLKNKLKEGQFDAIVSTDGDADRPLVMGDDGKLVPGEILGLITSRELGIETVVCPISCSSLIEASGWVPNCSRTKIGSPFVLGEIKKLIQLNPHQKIAGFEANGGYILSTKAEGLEALNTRDSMLPIIATLVAAKKLGAGKISSMLASLPKRTNLSGLVKDFSLARSKIALSEVDSFIEGSSQIGGLEKLGRIISVNRLDGPRLTFENSTIIHMRPSGNAPEFRIYVEADSEANAQDCLNTIAQWLNSSI